MVNFMPFGAWFTIYSFDQLYDLKSSLNICKLMKHTCTHTHTTIQPFSSSLPNSQATLQKASLSRTWQSAIFNPLRKIIAFALVPFQQHPSANASITTLVTSDPALIIRPYFLFYSPCKWMSNNVLCGVTLLCLSVTRAEMKQAVISKMFDSVYLVLTKCP